MKGYVKKTFTDEEVKKIIRIYDHYQNILDNYDVNNYRKLETGTTWYGRKYTKDVLDVGRIKDVCNDWLFQWSDSKGGSFLCEKHIFSYLRELVILLKQDTTVYLSEDLCWVLNKVKQENL